MKSFLPLVTIALVLSSCTAAYNSGQTPDDVYFSPQRPQNEYVRMETKKEQYGYEETEDDRYLRMKVRNRRMWSDLDYYYNDPIAYNYYYNRNYNNYFNSPWNFYSSWNYYHNPYSNYNPYGYGQFYGKPVLVVTPNRAPIVNRPRQYNMNVYDRNAGSAGPRATNKNNRVYNNSNGRQQPSYSTPNRDAGSNLRNVFGNSNNSSSSNNSRSTPPRTESSNSSSNSSSNKSSGSAPVRKF